MEKKRDSFFLPDKKNNKKIHTDQKKESNYNKLDQLNKKQHKSQYHKEKRQKEVDKSQNVDQIQEKKSFDKKAYRLKKYSKKYKIDQWEEQRKKKILRNYYKDIKNDPMAGSYKLKAFDEDMTDSNETGRYVRHPDLIEKEVIIEQNRKDPFWKAKEQYNKIKQDKSNRQQEIEKEKEERKQKIQEYKKKKQERFKKLSKKTKKGQPVMTGRLELLLEKIQNV